ncbi:hypothetical protein Ocin01_14119 [Orchesella cincta]|uniref:Uncharacterized protein n=1 Tax=Orchesella cincta TaxID=48709 RepID=A0A1D2MHU1_ORCCI|nr:hypothetical protein Ocin01_14119 [Orchesella cincta]
MCERYFIEFPPYETVSPEFLLEESLALVHPKEILIHSEVFFVPFEPMPEKPEKRIWLRNRKSVEPDLGAILKNNIRFMIRKTKHFGLLLSQLTWVGLLNFAEKRHILQQYDDDLRAASLYIIMLKKEATGLTQFINCLHMTGNHEIANVIEVKLELLLEDIERGYSYGQFADIEVSLDEWNGHSLPPKKRKTSADSGFDDEEREVEASVNVMGRQRRVCNIKPLDALDVIAIINGKEDSACKVELCKCGHYHQYPKWKDVNQDDSMKDPGYSVVYSFSKYFQRKCEKRTSVQLPRQGILSPVKQPVEVGSDLSHGVSEDLEFTQPRRSCSHRRLRFSSSNTFAAHPDDVQASEPENDGIESFNLKSKLPSFLRRFL